MSGTDSRTEDPRLKRLRTLAGSSIVGADLKWLLAEYDRRGEALEIVAEGVLCPELFPELDVEKDMWELQAKTAGVSAIAALEPTP